MEKWVKCPYSSGTVDTMCSGYCCHDFPTTTGCTCKPCSRACPVLCDVLLPGVCQGNKKSSATCNCGLAHSSHAISLHCAPVERKSFYTWLHWRGERMETVLSLGSDELSIFFQQTPQSNKAPYSKFLVFSSSLVLPGFSSLDSITPSTEVKPWQVMTTRQQFKMFYCKVQVADWKYKVKMWPFNNREL